MDNAQLKSFVARIPVEPLPRLLDRLAPYERGGEAPFVTLLLRGGGGVAGWIVGAHRARPGAPIETLLLQSAGQNGQRSEQLTYLSPHEVVGVRFESLQTAVEFAGGGAIDPAELLDSPGRLEVVRRALKVKADVEAAFGSALKLELETMAKEGAPERVVTLFAAWLPVLSAALLSLASRPDDRAEVLRQIERIVAVDGPETAAVREGRALKLVLPCDAPARRTAEDLLSVIEKAL